MAELPSFQWLSQRYGKRRSCSRVARSLRDARHIVGHAHRVAVIGGIASSRRDCESERSRLSRSAYDGTLYLLTLLVEAVLVLVPLSVPLLGAGLCALNLVGYGSLSASLTAFFISTGYLSRRGGMSVSRSIAYGLAYLLGIVAASGSSGARNGACMSYGFVHNGSCRGRVGIWTIIVGIGRWKRPLEVESQENAVTSG